MVVQCPTCQSKFRIADDKVTDRGVRVRCTSCKNVFQVRKAGAAANDPVPGPGNTMDLSSLDPAVISPASRTAPGRSPAIPARPAPAPSSARPAPAAARPPAAARSPDGAARRLDADDLFGMSELTGDAPLGAMAPAASNPVPSPPPPAAPANPLPSFDDIDLEVDDRPPRPSAAPKGSRPPPPPPEATASPRQPDESGEDAPRDAGAPALRDPFEGMNLGDQGNDAVELATRARKEKPPESRPEARPDPTAPLPPPVPEASPGRELVASALTGLVGAALAIAVVIAAALSDEASASWLGLGTGREIVATRVVSGLYDTAAGKPVFFIRGRVENRGARVRGPIRVTAELVSEGLPEARAEIIAGAEPTPEDVWSLRSTADVEKLNRALEVTPVERKLQPGGSLPFFAVISDPPADLQRHRLHVKLESVDAWVQPSKAGKGR